MSSYEPSELVDVTIKKGKKKASQSSISLLLLGFIAGVFLALASLAYIRITATLPGGWGTVVGAAIFPFGLICIVLAGGELVTGDMMVVSIALFAKKIKAAKWLKTILLVTLGNLLGSIFVAYFFGYLGASIQGEYADTVIKIAESKTHYGFLESFLSGVACNILVSVAVYLSYASKEFIGKIVGMYLPIMAFVASGFQHIVANMFYIPSAIFAGGSSWGSFAENFIPVYLGNFFGGAIMIGLIYYLSYNVYKSKES